MPAVPSLVAHDLVRIHGDRRVLDGVSLTASPGQRIGLVGENGVGKSTLLRLLAGLDTQDAGELSRPSDTGFLHQEPPFRADATVGSVVEDALAEIRAAQRRLDELANRLTERPEDSVALVEYGEWLDWAQQHEAWDADRRAWLVLAGLGLHQLAADRPLARLSGGQRCRLGLAALLIRRPAALLLDEPTNHLDDEAIGFLEKQVRALAGVVVLASHDRVFLDEVCTDIVDLDPAVDGPTRYGGTYSDYLAEKRAQRRRWEQRYATEQDELSALAYSVAVTSREVNHDRPIRDNNKVSYDRHGGRVQVQISRRVRNAQLRLTELTRDQVAKPPAPLRFSANLTSTMDGEGPVLALRSVRVPGRLAIDTLDIEADTRLLVTGGNGAGKSTLLAVLSGELAPTDGRVARRSGLRVGLLPQDVTFAQPHRSAAATYAAEVGDGVPLADLGLLACAEHDKAVGALSVGQRRRLALAMLIAATPQLLLLDEPTNHISLTLADELQDALHAAPGAIVLASHDRWLRRRWSGPELRLAGGEVSGERGATGPARDAGGPLIAGAGGR
ncbi:MAG TPA: ABC-F family ATP-binding cassette domain-containing protein [Pseudonocardiaceae bacterium]|nr:ABC-F family ATP-binding cassette domain-containing protein [Pseudonocardiaceae bacterium]